MSFFKIRPELNSLSLKNPLHCLALGFGGALVARDMTGTLGVYLGFAAALALWGWGQWLRKGDDARPALSIQRLSVRGWWWVVIASAALRGG